MSYLTQKLSFLVSFLFLLQEVDGFSQESTESPVQKATLSDSLWPSARAAGLGGSITGIANGMDAPYYNPAYIGSMNAKEKGKPFVTSVLFPYFSFSVNENTVKLNESLSKAGDVNDEEVAAQILRAHEGERQYGRATIAPAITLGRTMITYIYDNQLAAAAIAPGSDQIDVSARTMEGPALGFSFADSKDRFYLGFFSGFFTLKQTQGVFNFTDLNDPGTRKSAFGDATKTYEGSPLNIGTTWRLSPRWKPSLSLVFRDAGGTKYRANDEATEDFKVEEDFTMSFSLHPDIGKWGKLNTNLEAEKLTVKSIALRKKIKLGVEWTLGKRGGSSAGLGVRIGANNAGASGGLGINLGILGISVASSVEDVGVNNISVIERRTFVNFGVNVADY
ncbi:MAG: hypothetical protein HRU19_04975 [Pseudobacteriovorax sp.]|nr:hypothetical protein [Pseudobacteriovorax sp.]